MQPSAPSTCLPCYCTAYPAEALVSDTRELGSKLDAIEAERLQLSDRLSALYQQLQVHGPGPTGGGSLSVDSLEQPRGQTEMHPDDDGFASVAAALRSEIQDLYPAPARASAPTRLHEQTRPTPDAGEWSCSTAHCSTAPAPSQANVEDTALTGLLCAEITALKAQIEASDRLIGPLQAGLQALEVQSGVGAQEQTQLPADPNASAAADSAWLTQAEEIKAQILALGLPQGP